MPSEHAQSHISTYVAGKGAYQVAQVDSGQLSDQLLKVADLSLQRVVQGRHRSEDR
jgi:hypothetical protein